VSNIEKRKKYYFEKLGRIPDNEFTEFGDRKPLNLLRR